MSDDYCLVIQPIHPVGYERLKAAGIEPRLASAFDMETVAREIGGAVAAITRNAGLSRKAIEAAPKLKVIGNHGIGTDPVDVAYATELGIPVVNNPYTNVQSVAEANIALMLAVARQVKKADAAVRAGNFRFKFEHRQMELWRKKLGIIGWGNIGRRTAEIARAGFQMEILVYSPSADAKAVAEQGGRKCERLEELMREADIVALHVQLKPSTRGMIGPKEIALMKPSAIFVNTARGAAVDELALAEALKEGRIAGAGIDVFAKEPPPLDHPLLQLDNVVLAPHSAGSTEECLWRTGEEVASEVVDVLQGRRPPYIVNPECWDRRRR